LALQIIQRRTPGERLYTLEHVFSAPPDLYSLLQELRWMRMRWQHLQRQAWRELGLLEDGLVPSPA
jgi:hypothetical protein